MQTGIAALVLALAPQAVQAPPSFAAEHDRFVLELLRSVTRERGNVLLSPYSVAGAIALAREGAKGDTAAEIDAVFHFPAGAALEALQQSAEALTPKNERPSGQPAYELGLANSLWRQSGYPLTPEYLRRVGGVGRAQVFEVDFASAASGARDKINAWVSEHTKTRIPELIPPGSPPPATRLVLANAVYLKARWASPFLASRTMARAFHAPAGEVSVPMMAQRARFSLVGRSERAQVLALPYVGGLDMLIVLPDEVDGLAAVLAEESFADWTAALQPALVELVLPKFQFENAYDLVPQLAQLGMRAAFSPELADFSGLSSRARDPRAPLYIGVVRHKSWIAVDEAGTEAAAATSVEIKAGSAMRPDNEVLSFVADHPFLFFVRQRSSGQTLFAGRVDDPAH
ncbi:MAG: serpin family protein [Planctomycetes bacterium]|nr:serpin family protein [Planctomycetota bacterium]